MSDSKSIPSIDIVEELSSNSEQYTGPAKIRLGAGWLIPWLETNLEIIRACADSRPRFEEIISFCVLHCIQAIRSDADIQELLRLKERLKKQEDATYVEEILGFQSLKSCDLDRERTPKATKKQVSTLAKEITLPKTTEKEVSTLAKELKVDREVIVSLSMILALSKHQRTFLKHQGEVLYRAFFDRVQLRRKLAEAYLREREAA